MRHVSRSPLGLGHTKLFYFIPLICWVFFTTVYIRKNSYFVRVWLVSLIKDLNIVDCMGRSYLLQHRFCGQEGDCSWGCDSIECLGKHIKGEKCTNLANICVSSWVWNHRSKETNFI